MTKDKTESGGEGEEQPRPLVLSGASPIQVKFIGWLVLVCAGGFGGWIWWAASMSTKLDTVISQQALQLAMVKSVSEDISRMKEWRIQIDTIGSQATVRRLDAIEVRMGIMEKNWEIHKATTVNQP